MLMLRRLLALLTAVIVTAAGGAIIQTQFNIAALAGLQVDIDTQQRLAMTGGDLLYFAPVFAGLLAIAYLPAFGVAGLLTRHRPGRPAWLYALAGGSAVLIAFLIMNQLLPMTAVQMTTRVSGLLALTLTGVLGGWIFTLALDRLIPPRR